MADTVLSAKPLAPSEHPPITFVDAPGVAVRRDDGRSSLAICDLYGTAMLDPSSPMRRISTPPKLQPGRVTCRLPAAGGPQARDALALARVATWLSAYRQPTGEHLSLPEHASRDRDGG